MEKRGKAMSNTRKKNTFTLGFSLLIIFFGMLMISCQSIEEKNDFPEISLFFEITVEEGIEFDYVNRFEFSSFHTSTQRQGFGRSGAHWQLYNAEIGEVSFTVPGRPAYIKQGEVVEFQIYQITQEMIVADDTNRFQDNEWISDNGWLIDRAIFYLTVEFIVENEVGSFEITKRRYENGEYLKVDEIRFINHYLGEE